MPAHHTYLRELLSLLISASRRSPSSAVWAITKIVSLPASEPSIGQLCRINGGGDAGSRARLSLDHNQIIGTQNARYELGNHTLQVQVLCQNIDALRELTQPHIGNIARDSRLRAIKAHSTELIDQHALRADILIAHQYL